MIQNKEKILPRTVDPHNSKPKYTIVVLGKNSSFSF